ncbi:MAG TPA: (Fe-S)-binding protein, partial [Streptomyces sp.]
TRQRGAAAVYYPACVNRLFGPPRSAQRPAPRRRTALRQPPTVTAPAWLPQALVTVSARAGMPVWIPPDVTGTCCAAVWNAKGYDAGNAVMANRIVEHAWVWTAAGRLPLIVDAASCTLGLARGVVPHLTAANRELHGELTIVDSVVWAADHLLSRLTVTDPTASALLHPVCSLRHLGAADALETVARACARCVVTPDDAECCAFAGDRGLLQEELTAAATRREAEEVAARAYDAYLCADRMCELGMEHATGERYESVLIALERATR